MHAESLLNDGIQNNTKAGKVVMAAGAKAAGSPAAASPKQSLFGGFGAKATEVGAANPGAANPSLVTGFGKPAAGGIGAKPGSFGGFGAEPTTAGLAAKPAVSGFGTKPGGFGGFGAKPAAAGLAAKPAAGGFDTPKGKKKGPVKAVFQNTNVRRPPLPASHAPSLCAGP